MGLDSMLTRGPRGIRHVTLIRHGRTASNAARRFMGTTDDPLDDIGREQVLALHRRGGVGQVDASICSPLLRARQTASLLALRPREVGALRELDQGLLEGLTPQEALSRFPAFFRAWAEDPGRVAVPGGERLDACRDRALSALHEHVACVPEGGHLVAVTHLLVIASVRCTIAGQSLARWRDHRVGNAGVVRLTWNGASWREVSVLEVD